MKKVAVIGSSGGNLFNLGGKEPGALLGEMKKQLEAAELEVSHVQFVAAGQTMDGIKPEAPASLWTLAGGVPVESEKKSLREINALATERDAALAEAIAQKQIDALVLISANPDGVNRLAIEAAAKAGIPATGTGGASVSKAQVLGLKVIAVSGTTGTTNRTRAIASAVALAKFFNTKYRPVLGSVEGGSAQSPFKRINVRGILMSSLPGFIATALSLAVWQILTKVAPDAAITGLFETIQQKLLDVLPVIIAAVAARQVSGHNEVGIVGGVVAGILSTGGGILGGLVGGILGGILIHYIILFALGKGWPGTTANIVGGGISGLIAGLLVFFFLAPVALWLGNSVRGIIDWALAINAPLCGLLAGLLIWPAIMAGVYHAAILPIALFEMEKYGFSFLGAVDMCSLVMVSAGITLANIIAPRQKSERPAASVGFFINMIFGTYVEAAYPFMLSSKVLFAAALAAAGLGGLTVGIFNVKSTAYVASFVAPGLSNNALGMVIAMAVSLGSACVFYLVLNRILGKKPDVVIEE
ncbi:PTS sugar transporter [Spirochaetia bacterium]|nr:PTS sugar transporter [Spirochaetia bacterium]